ncbi:hypothetical protein [Paenibacillus sp. NRS-1760]|uniref:hypothetical protein n=1 Tax=Paenibacillus sp. NRS-1760 TaxID=3233902 RepID=UPI003D265BE4
MKESEIRTLFFRMANLFNFSYDDYTVEEWLRVLEHIPFEQAEVNLDAYALNPDNEYAPRPGILAAKSILQAKGPAVLDAAETMIMLENRDKETFVPMPKTVKEAMKRIALSTTNDRDGTRTIAITAESGS